MFELSFVACHRSGWYCTILMQELTLILIALCWLQCGLVQTGVQSCQAWQLVPSLQPAAVGRLLWSAGPESRPDLAPTRDDVTEAGELALVLGAAKVLFLLCLRRSSAAAAILHSSLKRLLDLKFRLLLGLQ